MHTARGKVSTCVFKYEICIESSITSDGGQWFRMWGLTCVYVYRDYRRLILYTGYHSRYHVELVLASESMQIADIDCLSRVVSVRVSLCKH